MNAVVTGQSSPPCRACWLEEMAPERRGQPDIQAKWRAMTRNYCLRHQRITRPLIGSNTGSLQPTHIQTGNITATFNTGPSWSS